MFRLKVEIIKCFLLNFDVFKTNEILKWKVSYQTIINLTESKKDKFEIHLKESEFRFNCRL